MLPEHSSIMSAQAVLIYKRLTVVDEERTNGLSDNEPGPDAIRPIGVPPGDTDHKQLCRELRRSYNHDH